MGVLGRPAPAILYVLIAYLGVTTFALIFVQVIRRRKTKPVEGFFSTTAMELRSLDVYGRRLVFPYHANVRPAFNAAERARADLTTTSLPPGKCALINTSGAASQALDPSFAVVTERGLAYTLRRACLALRAVNPRLSNNNRSLTLTFPMQHSDDVNNVMRFLLLQPLFVEFNMNTMYTVAYAPRYGFANVSSHAVKGRRLHTSVDVVFDVLLPKSNGGCDVAFDYRNARSAVQLTDTRNLFDKGNVHLSVYYIDPDVGSSFQDTGRTLRIAVPPETTSVTVFDPAYRSFAGDIRRLTTYEFMNNVALMYHNFVPPTFTFKLVLRMSTKLTQGSTQTIVQCNMDTALDGAAFPRSCSDFNLWGLSARYVNDDMFDLVAQTDDGRACGAAPSRSPNAVVRLPYLSSGAEHTVLVTLAPNEKRLYAEWQDVAVGNLAKSWALGLGSAPYGPLPSDACVAARGWDRDATPSQINHLCGIFARRNLTPRPRLGAIALQYARTAVARIESVTLGHVNLLRQINIESAA